MKLHLHFWRKKCLYLGIQNLKTTVKASLPFLTLKALPALTQPTNRSVDKVDAQRTSIVSSFIWTDRDHSQDWRAVIPDEMGGWGEKCNHSKLFNAILFNRRDIFIATSQIYEEITTDLNTIFETNAKVF